MAGKILKVLESALNFVMLLIFLIIGAYAAFALWDNYRIYNAAEGVRDDLLSLKPDPDTDGGTSFEELLAINPDVCAWLTLDGTNIDHAIVQGETNLEYINKDVYGDYALAGSIFLDTRNSRDFSDRYNLIYGHHMENSGMFGDLDLYKEEKFFEENSTGTLILPDATYELDIFAVVVASADDDEVYDPELYQENIDGLMEYLKENAVCIRKELPEDPQILSMSTCSSEYTNARTVVLAEMRSSIPDERSPAGACG